MNPLLLLLLGLGGFMTVMGGSGEDEIDQTTDAATLPPEPEPEPAPEPAPEPDDDTAAAIGITMVVYDMANKDVVHEIADGDEIDFGEIEVSDYTFAAEVTGGVEVGSMILEYQGRTWLQNFHPYTLEDSSLDLAAGDFEVKVTAYSGPDGTGDALGTETVAFATTSTVPPEEEEEPPVVEEEPPAVVDEEPQEETPPPPAEEQEPPVVEEEPPAVVDEEPQEETPPPAEEEEPPVVVDDSPAPPPQSGGDGSGGQTDPVVVDGTVKVMAGRVATLDPADDDIASLEVVSGLSHGRVTVNPDNTLAVVLTLSDKASDQSFTYEATHADGSTSTHKVNLDVTPGMQDQGWGTGSTHYMLETDENDNVVVEAGDNHTKVYVSGSNAALSRADIAGMEDISVNQVTGSWLAASGKYGQSEDFALDQATGNLMWDAVTSGSGGTSDWLLLERGYSYNDMGNALQTAGEDPLHPLYMGAWGEGDKPVITDEFAMLNDNADNIVIQGIELTGGVRIVTAENIIFDDISVREDEMVIWRSDSITVRNSDFIDIAYDKSKDGGDWEAHADRIQGLFSNKADGVLLEGLYFDHNGWTDGYDPDGSGSAGQPPSMFSHNLYLGAEQTDLTLRDTISMRGASFGAQVRPGGFIEDNALIDNNFGMSSLGGDYKDAGPVGNYTLMNGNLVTSGAHKEAPNTGALTTGLMNRGELTTLLDNIVAHLADPDNPDELAEKTVTHNALKNHNETYYDDTIIYNWHGSDPASAGRRVTEQNTEGLAENVLDQTTIQLFAAQLLGKETATIADLADYLKAQAEGALDDVVDADLIVRFFQEGFGIAPDIRTEAETARFVPDDLGEGVRWDNRLNWSTEDLPGTVTGDDVDLGGNTVIYNGLTTEIGEMELGPDGELRIYGGKLTATGGMTTENGGGDVTITDSGQLWTDGHDGADLDVDIVGGRFVNTGALTDTTLSATGGEAILATGGAIYGVSQGETLSVSGDAEVGFDDDDGGAAILAFERGSTLELGVRNGKLGSIEEVRSGAFGDSPDVRSGIDLGDAMLEIDLSGLSAAQGEDLALLDADELIGAFDDANVSGLGSRDATVVIDYVNDSVSLKLASGSGQVAFQTVGQATDVSDGEQALWDALTEGQGVFDETTPDPALPEDEEEYLEAS